LKYSLIAASDLDPQLRRHWTKLVQDNPHLASPYFSVEFTQAVAAVREDVRIVVMEDDHGIVGFFPFQRAPFGRGRPVGGPLSDQHGVIAAGDTHFDARDLLRAARLTSWEFDHLLADQASFGPFQTGAAVSPILDLTGGYEAYVRSRLDAGSSRIRQLERKARKFAREVGPLRWVPHVTDMRELRHVFAGKSEQCRAAGLPDVFEPRWTGELLRRVLETQEPNFAGCLSALYVGDEVVAMHAGMRSDRAWHWWFPVYNHEHAPYSPGMLLLLEVAREAAGLGLAHVDLGKGSDVYKLSFANAEIPLIEGCVTRASVGNLVRSWRDQAEERIRRSHLADPVRPALRRGNHWVRQRRFR
jgi:CelD/BcsL family acetyltransferase involved in cellulose biosynthesis